MTVSSGAVVVLGGSGLVGEALARRWRSDRPLLYLVHRSQPEWLNGLGVAHRHVDLESIDSIVEAAEGAGTAINLLRPVGDGWYPRTLRTILPSLKKASVSHFVQASSIDVYNGSSVTYASSTTPVAPRSAYELEHVEAEALVANAFDHHLVLRLGAVFGPGGKNLVSLARDMAHAPYAKLALRRALYGARRMHLVSLATVCAALEAASAFAHEGEHPVFNITDDTEEHNNFAFVQDGLARHMGRSGLSSVPQFPAPILGLALRARGLSPAIARRRFQDDTLRLGAVRSDFVAQFEAYATLLADEPVDVV